MILVTGFQILQQFFTFSVQPDTGKITLLSNVPEMSFEISVRVEDNKGLVKISKIRITIIFVTDDALFNAGAIRIDGNFKFYSFFLFDLTLLFSNFSVMYFGLYFTISKCLNVN